MRYTQYTEDQVTRALKTIGAGSINELFRTVPSELRLKGELDLPEGLSELELLDDVTALAGRNVDCTQQVCFLGGGAYDHFVPTLVDAVAAQTEFLTAYTPYQAEASQGILQLFYEFQTFVCELTGMEVANASLYEFASAAAEAMLMSQDITRRKRLIVAETVHPDILAVLRTYTQAQDVTVDVVPARDGVIDEEKLESMLSDDTAAVLVQSPNFFGCIERLDRIIPAIHQRGALAVVSADPIACGLLRRPGDLDADIVVGEGQPLGIPLQYGAPYLGLLACREKYLRKMPGRIVGATKDTEGRRGFCLVLQTREQHIKRERATSNICTNQGLLAVRAAVYMAAMGRQGIAKVARQCFDKAHYAAEKIAALSGYEVAFDAPFFKEFTVRTKRNVEEVLTRCRDAGIAAGVHLARFGDEYARNYADCFLIAVTEKRTKADIDALVKTLDKA